MDVEHTETEGMFILNMNMYIVCRVSEPQAVESREVPKEMPGEAVVFACLAAVVVKRTPLRSVCVEDCTNIK